jgi:KDO2-lipid IV(A) lauroyltransferase
MHVSLLLRFIAWLPLRVVLGLGAAMGWMTYLLSPRFRRQTRANLAQAGFDVPRIRREAVAQTGRQILETFWFWLRPHADVAARVRDANAGELDALLVEPGPLLLLTPHIGSFEAFAQYYMTRPAAGRRSLTVLYRAPRKRALRSIVELRGAQGVQLAPADTRGVRLLLRALKQGMTAGILPDQVPAQGEGVWAPFFNRAAYTMTLPARLSVQTRARVVLVFCERCPRGQYRAHYVPLDGLFVGDAEQDAAALNRALEDLIRRAPAQYLWCYNRYKTPAGAKPPPGLMPTTAVSTSGSASEAP